jgi:hypothetical protein
MVARAKRASQDRTFCNRMRGSRSLCASITSRAKISCLEPVFLLPGKLRQGRDGGQKRFRRVQIVASDISNTGKVVEVLYSNEERKLIVTERLVQSLCVHHISRQNLMSRTSVPTMYVPGKLRQGRDGGQKRFRRVQIVASDILNTGKVVEVLYSNEERKLIVT